MTEAATDATEVSRLINALVVANGLKVLIGVGVGVMVVVGVGVMVICGFCVADRIFAMTMIPITTIIPAIIRGLCRCQSDRTGVKNVGDDACGAGDG